MALRLATCRRLPKTDPDAGPLREALRIAGIDARLAAWDDPAEPWDEPIPTLIRSTWNYTLDRDAFVAWAERAGAAAPLWNPPAIVRWNTSKTYLADLAAAGHAVVPTVFAAHGEEVALAPLLDARGWRRMVVKPTVGAGSRRTRWFDRDDVAAAQAFLDELLAERDAMIQPYVASVGGYGERCLVCIDGRFTHAVRKSPRFEGDAESVTGPVAIAGEERALADAVLAPYAARLLYARIDLARDDDGRPMVMELEAVEPSLFFAEGPEALDRLVRALAERLAART